jgi:hypothetical protein
VQVFWPDLEEVSEDPGEVHLKKNLLYSLAQAIDGKKRCHMMMNSFARCSSL